MGASGVATAVLGADSAANLRGAHPPTADPEMPCCAGEARSRRGTQRSCSAAVGRFPHPDDGCSGLTQLAQFYLTCRVRVMTAIPPGGFIVSVPEPTRPVR